MKKVKAFILLLLISIILFGQTELNNKEISSFYAGCIISVDSVFFVTYSSYLADSLQEPSRRKKEDVFLDKYNSKGELQWSKTIDYAEYETPISIVLSPDSCFYILIEYGNNDKYGWKTYIIKTNFNGEIIWRKEMGKREVVDIMNNNNDGLYCIYKYQSDNITLKGAMIINDIGDIEKEIQLGVDATNESFIFNKMGTKDTLYIVCRDYFGYSKTRTHNIDDYNCFIGKRRYSYLVYITDASLEVIDTYFLDNETFIGNCFQIEKNKLGVIEYFIEKFPNPNPFVRNPIRKETSFYSIYDDMGLIITSMPFDTISRVGFLIYTSNSTVLIAYDGLGIITTYKIQRDSISIVNILKPNEGYYQSPTIMELNESYFLVYIKYFEGVKKLYWMKLSSVCDSN